MASVAYHPYTNERSERKTNAKDPNKPKKKKSAFDVFRAEQMSEFKRLNPETKVDLGVFMTNLSATWGSLSDEKKIPYVQESEKDLIRFQAEMANYIPNPEFAKKKKKRVKEPGEPKRATTGFMFFSNTNRAEVVRENPDLRVGGIAKIMGERWGKMTIEEKAPYQKMAEDDKERYLREATAWRKAKENGS